MRRGRGSLASGFAALGHWRLAALLLVCTVAPALIAGSSLWPALQDSFGKTLAGDQVLRNDPTMAPTDVFDFLRENKPAVAGTWRAGIVAAAFGVLAQIFFAGGFVEVLGFRSRPARAGFFEASRRNFGHNLKCFGIFFVLAGAVLVLWIGAGVAAARKLFEGAPPGETPSFLFRLGILLGALLLFALFSLLHDFARAERRVTPAIGAFRAYAAARRRLRRRWLRALALFSFWGVLGAVLLGGLFAATWALAAPSLSTVLLLFALQLAALAVRPLIRVAAWGSYVALLDSAVPPPEPEPIPNAAVPEPALPASLLDETPWV